jgi:hypothetical protein
MSKKKNQIVRHSSGGLVPSRWDRAIGKELDRINARADLARHSDRRRIERIVDAAQHGAVAVTHLSALEGSLVQTVPHAQPRVTAIADAGALGIAKVVFEAGR